MNSVKYINYVSFFLLMVMVGTLYPKCGNDLYYGKPTSCFINRWSFQELADHVFDPCTGKFHQPTTRKEGGVTFDPADVMFGDTVFVRKIDIFMKTLHPKIKVPYIMLTHGDYLDTVCDENLRYLDDEKIIAWFAIHPPKKGHPKFYPIPLGVVQKREVTDSRKYYKQFFEQLRAVPKTKLLNGLFSPVANNERKLLAEAMQKKKFYSHSSSNLPFKKYMQELASSVFTLSPRGWGADCYRTWEALLVGTIPIVQRGQHGFTDISRKIAFRSSYSAKNNRIHAQLDRLYEQLPILVIDDWNEITEKFLKKKYKEISSKKYNIELLYIDYWKSVIAAVKEEYINNYKR